MTQQEQKEREYITDGLVLWLDGIDKGNVQGEWIDKISGYIFTATNSVVFGSNYVETGADAYLTNNTFTSPRDVESTIEVVAERAKSGNSELVYMSKVNGISFGFLNGAGTGVIFSTASNQRWTRTSDGDIIFSLNRDRIIINGKDTEIVGYSYWGGADSNNYIGKRSTGAPYSGKIYAIRIYDRILPADEILNNQRVDNKRYNLGLRI